MASSTEQRAIQGATPEGQAIFISNYFALNSMIRQVNKAPNSGCYYKHTKGGVYSCAGCTLPLYNSIAKFDTRSGWAAFFQGNEACRFHRCPPKSADFDTGRLEHRPAQAIRFRVNSYKNDEIMGWEILGTIHTHRE